jgi:hypothetical protein
MAWPWLSVTVTHQVERGLRAAAARSRARSESPGAVHGMRSDRSASGPGPAHDYSADISGKVQRGRKRCTCMAWSEGQPTSGSAELSAYRICHES